MENLTTATIATLSLNNAFHAAGSKEFFYTVTPFEMEPDAEVINAWRFDLEINYSLN